MKKLFLTYLSYLFFSGFTFGSSKVYFGEIVKEIDLGLVPYVERIISEAEKNSADLIVFKINTFGGRVDAATQIKDAILNSSIPTVAFIDKRAISAGALISLSCQTIIMVPGASIGATTVVDQQGQKVSEKYQSYMRSEMRATAERNGRPTDVAEAMVDERIVIEGLTDSTNLVTLTSEEAVEWGIADEVSSELIESLEKLGYEKPRLITIEESWSESLLRFLNNPIITSLLIMVGIIGIFTEIKSPGWGVPGTVGTVALIIYFGAGYIVNLASYWEIIAFIIGVVLIILEIFVIPGFGVAGIAGLLLMSIGLFLGLISDFRFVDESIFYDAIIQFAVILVLTLVIILIISKYLPKTNMWNNLILSTNIDSSAGYIVSDESFHYLLNKIGVALTDLRPSGTCKIENKRVDVVTSGEYITKNSEVKVIQIQGSKIVVEKI